MKKILSAILALFMLSGGAVSAFAEERAKSLVLKESSHLVLDRESGYIDMIDGTMIVRDLKAEFEGSVSVVGKGATAYVATDDIVGVGSDTIKALIWGDCDRNGRVNLRDVSDILKLIAKWDTGINTIAADVDRSGDVNLSDVSKYMKYLAKWDDISLGNVRWVFENKKLTAPSENARMNLFFSSSLLKIGRSKTGNTGEHAYKMKLARNETESCQFYITTTANMSGLTVELSDFEHEYGEGTLNGEIFIHHYYKMEVHAPVLKENGPTVALDDYFPEHLLPLADSFEVKAFTNQSFTINVKTGKDTPAGLYKATLTVRDSAGKAVKCANVYTEVWDFTLPDTPYCKSSFGLSGYSIYATLGRLDRKWYEGDDHYTHSLYYEFLVENNISAYQLPYDIRDTRADALMSDPRVTSFEICGENLRSPELDNRNDVIAKFRKVQSNPVWAEKGHFYYVDEPWEAGAASIKYQHEYLTSLLGTDDFDIILPFQNSMADKTNNIDMLDFIYPYVDIFVPGTHGFMPNYEGNHYYEGLWTPRQAYAKYGESLPRLQAIKNDPEKELWWYTCVTPQFPFPNLFTTYQGVMTRVIWWQQFMYDVDGFLYWATQADWDALAQNPTQYPGNGDGNLLYVGEMHGRTGPVASWRLTVVRDAFDDFDYLRMAEELVGRETVMRYVHHITTGVTTVVEDYKLMEQLRDEIAQIIVENQK